MALAELALSAQRAVDRLIRRLRRGAALTPTHWRLLVVQIDGLSRAVLEEALASGSMPFLARLLKRHDYRLKPMAVGLPTSTAAFHMAVMYGVRPDIPGFHYYDRQLRGDIHFPRAGHAAAVEAKQAAGRRGILHGGSAYGCVFTESANNNLFSFISLTWPKGGSVVNALSAFVVASWVFAKSLTQTKIGISVWVRQFFMMAAARDLYAGVPRIYVLDTVASLHADALDHRFPGLAEDLSKSRGIGFVLARSESGPVYFWRGQRYQLGLAEPGPFARRADAALVLQAS
jgi:hypothetical protein